MGVRVGGMGRGVELGAGMTVMEEFNEAAPEEVAGLAIKIYTRLPQESTAAMRSAASKTLPLRIFFIYTGSRKKARLRIR
jgi:hypothetical protein